MSRPTPRFRSPPVGHWRSERGRQAYAASYAAAMARLPAAGRTRDVGTDFGTVRVYDFVSNRTRGLTPIVLLPGRASGVPMWAENLPGFVGSVRFTRSMRWVTRA